MDRAEFLETLRNQLTDQMQEGKVAAHVRYYQDYIQEQVNGGRAEAEVLSGLGDPRLIAKTLLNTDIDSGQENYSDDSAGKSGGYYSEEGRADGPIQKHIRKLDLSTWYGKAIVIVAAAVIIFLLVTILTAVIPFFLILMVVLFIISRFRKR